MCFKMADHVLVWQPSCSWSPLSQQASLFKATFFTGELPKSSQLVASRYPERVDKEDSGTFPILCLLLELIVFPLYRCFSCGSLFNGDAPACRQFEWVTTQVTWRKRSNGHWSALTCLSSQCQMDNPMKMQFHRLTNWPTVRVHPQTWPKGWFNQWICIYLTPLFPSPGSSSQVGVCGAGEACLLYTWQKSRTETGSTFA